MSVTMSDDRPKPQICDFSIMHSAVMNGADGEANRKAFGEQCEADGMRYIVNRTDETHGQGMVVGFVGDDDQVLDGWELMGVSTELLDETCSHDYHFINDESGDIMACICVNCKHQVMGTKDIVAELEKQ